MRLHTLVESQTGYSVIGMLSSVYIDYGMDSNARKSAFGPALRDMRGILARVSASVLADIYNQNFAGEDKIDPADPEWNSDKVANALLGVVMGMHGSDQEQQFQALGDALLQVPEDELERAWDPTPYQTILSRR